MHKISKRRQKEIENAANNRRELIEAKLSRRDLIRMGLITGAGYLVTKHGLSARAQETGRRRGRGGDDGGGGDGGGQPTSPPTRPFFVPLPIMPTARPVPSLNPAPTAAPNPAAGEARRTSHQKWNQFLPQKLYDIHEQEALQSFHPDLPPQTIWGFSDGTGPARFPGPTYHSRYGEPALVRMHNDLPANHQGFGIPQTTTHLHNGHTPSESDGFPGDFFNSGFFWDQHYPNVLAGFTDPRYAPAGDPREALGTMWYHDHRFDFTAQNAYKGLIGTHLIFDNQDSGDETDANPAAFRLPSGDFDVPLLFADKVFDSNGHLFFDLFNTDGILGDKFMVNGAIQPFFQVHPRKYRLRCINAGPSRWYKMFLTDVNNLSSVFPMTLIANDGNLLPAPLPVTSFQIAIAERMDVIIDFSQFTPGSSIFLENRLEQNDGRGPTGNTLAAGQGNFVMRFDVVLPRVSDPSNIPLRLRTLPPVNMNEVATTRTWRFERTQGAWAINGKFFDVNRVDAAPKRNTAEIWVLQNNSGGWMHPIHLHLEEHQILTRNGALPPNFERGRKDVAELRHNETVQFFMRFRDWVGRYPLHCHNMIHEDHMMMTVWQVVP